MATRLGLVVFGFVALVGCAPNMEELQGLVDKQLEASRNYNEAVKGLSAAPSGNRSAEEGVAFQMRMAFLQRDLKDMKPDILGPILTYDYKVRRLPLDWFDSFWSSPNTGLVLCTFPLDCARNSGGGSFDISAKDQGSIIVDSSSFGNKSPVARDDATISNDDSALATESATAATNDGQIQTGDGVQGQAFTDPPNQPNLSLDGGGGDDSPGGSLNNNSSFEPGVGQF